MGWCVGAAALDSAEDNDKAALPELLLEVG